MDVWGIFFISPCVHWKKLLSQESDFFQDVRNFFILAHSSMLVVLILFLDQFFANKGDFCSGILSVTCLRRAAISVIWIPDSLKSSRSATDLFL